MMNDKLTASLLLCLILLSPALFGAPSIDEVQKNFLLDLQEQVLVHDSRESLHNLAQIKSSLTALKSAPTQQVLDQLQADFRRFVGSWKALEASYILGALDDNYVDHPRFIDYFHQAKESIPEQVEKALNSQKPLQKALFKYSTKSINALEYLLFAQPEQGSLLPAMGSRRIEAAEIAVANINLWLSEIAEGYQVEEQLFADGNTAIGLLVNGLIDSSYKLANWRIGEAGGLTKKYAGKQSAQRLEYALSASSYVSIEAILQTHRKVVDRDDAVDLLALAQIKNAETEVLFIRDQIDAALSTLATMPQPLSKQLASEQYQILYEQLQKIHKAYYFMLIDALSLNANIIDADGD